MDMSITEIERIAKLEQHMLDQDQKLNSILTDIKEIKIMLGIQSSLKTEIIDLKDDLNDLKKSTKLWNWLSPTLSAGAATVLTILIASYLGKLN